MSPDESRAFLKARQTWPLSLVLMLLVLLQIEGLTPPATDSIPSQVPDADSLLSAEGEDHREVGTHVVT